MSGRSLVIRAITLAFLLVVSSSFFATLPAVANATVIQVTSTDHEIAPFVADGDCTLGEALASAAADRAIDGCTSNQFGSGGPFFISLAPNSTYTLSNVDNILAGDNGLPVITREVTIQGYYATIERNLSAPNFRLFYVANTGRLTLDSVRLQNGIATSDGTRCQETGWACGGAILNEGGLVTIRNSFITNNVAEAGGGIMTVDGTAAIENSTFSENFAVGAQGQGGAIAQFGSLSLTIENSTIANNGAEKRGGGLQNEGNTVIRHVTFYGNSAEVGGNIRNYQGSIDISRSILADALEGGNCATLEGTTVSSGFNVEDANDCEFAQGTDQSNTPTGLGPLTSSNFTPFFPLESNSVAIDTVPAGSPDCQSGITGDQRFNVRADGVSRGGNGCDSGAYEFDSSALVLAISIDRFDILNDSGSVGPTPFAAVFVLLALFTAILFRRTILRHVVAKRAAATTRPKR